MLVGCAMELYEQEYLAALWRELIECGSNALALLGSSFALLKGGKVELGFRLGLALGVADRRCLGLAQLGDTVVADGRDKVVAGVGGGNEVLFGLPQADKGGRG